MFIESLAVTDFRVFQGRQEFDLTPRIKHGKKRPVILFGGLNGAGKTTTLTAVRLALYGKQSLGIAISQKAYEDYLRKNIHRPKNSPVIPTYAAIELRFTYTSQGELKHYMVKRAWTLSRAKVHETLQIFDNDKLLENLGYDQCQTFLNELVPIGVSDLFFFDGEKIKELAEESGGAALGDSIKKLLGLDLIERLNADLAVLIRNQQKTKVSSEILDEIEQLEALLKSTQANIEKEQTEIDQLRIASAETRSNIQRIENDINSRGGAWASTREKELEKQATLTEQRTQLQEQLREVIAGSYPLALARRHVTHVLTELASESESRRATQTAELIKEHLVRLESKFSRILDKPVSGKVLSALNQEFSAYFKIPDTETRRHDISDTALGRIQTVIQDAIHHQAKKANELAQELDAIEEKIDASGLNIARAPEQDTLKPLIAELNQQQQESGRLEQRITQHRENAKALIRTAMDVVRKLEKLHEDHANVDEHDRALRYANASRQLLGDFVKEMTVRKVKDLENEFVKCFHALARKDDLTSSIRINPETFNAELIDQQGNTIDKEELSAGEKQIYAISILEALGRTSGRKLPIIIDTPLGRLDSIHRKNLVENYFPYASHQVIILSTDTEVDSNFYRDLGKHISHAYHLEFDRSTKSTFASEGYFWKQRESA